MESEGLAFNQGTEAQKPEGRLGVRGSCKVPGEEPSTPAAGEGGGDISRFLPSLGLPRAHKLMCKRKERPDVEAREGTTAQLSRCWGRWVWGSWGL